MFMTFSFTSSTA